MRSRSVQPSITESHNHRFFVSTQHVHVCSKSNLASTMAEATVGTGTAAAADGERAASTAKTATTSTSQSATARPPKFAELLRLDTLLEGFQPQLCCRYQKYASILENIEKHEGGLDKFSRGYEFMGFTHEDGGIRFREWMPSAQAVFLTGDFNGWNRRSHPLAGDMFGRWEIFLPNQEDGSPAIEHNTFVKLSVIAADGRRIERIPAWIRRAVQRKGQIHYEGMYTAPSTYQWNHQRPPMPAAPKIYEAHIGISSEEPKVASYVHFADNVVPRIAKLGYNTIQLMAVMEHAYYGCFGYQVTSFFAASSRYGTQDELKYLIDCAHGAGLVVLLDVVHSHASKNSLDGLGEFDGSDSCFFHAGSRGRHDQWDSCLFNYSAWEVLRFLLSNLRWWLEEFRFDGFRFDGVTSMLYLHHGLGRVFTSYNDYFDDSIDVDACIYLMLANTTTRMALSSAITISEDVSGMPAMCRPVEEGGLGFDYRLGMAIPDMWIKLLKEVPDDQWEMGHIVHVLTNRRYKEGTIAYAESHDQALVGDKTLAFWLMDAAMYTHMSLLSEPSHIVDRGLALHKMIRLICHSLGGEGYLNFIGNEFGHPEWLDFPREGNGESFAHARRQWHLVDDDLLKYKFLNAFDAKMNQAEEQASWLQAPQAYVSLKHEDDKVIVFERAGLVFAFNFHPTKSFSDYRIATDVPGKYKLLLCSDDPEFGGHQRLDASSEHFTTNMAWMNRRDSFLAYLPSRVACVYSRHE
eukprot:m.124794 g.124794  ORF g.124794 m.124794 type:complete len:746 (-) comp16634_c1_seq2:1115-3352(-)